MHRSLWLRALARALFVRRPSSSRPRRSTARRVQLRLEHLEDRITPSDNTMTSFTSLVPPTPIYNSGGENIALTAQTVDTSVTPNTGVTQGQIQFGIDGNNLGSPVTSSSPAGSFTLSTTVPNTYNVGTHNLSADFSDTSKTPLYNTSTGNGSLTIDQANSSTTVSVTNSPVYNSSSEMIDLKANVSSTDGGTVNQGSVVFTINGVSTAAESVVNGVATGALVLPAGSVLIAGNYVDEISAAYSDTATNDYASSNASSNLTVGSAATTTSITSTTAASTYNSTTSQTVTLTASVVDNNGGGLVNEGSVTFTVVNPNGTNLTVTSDTVSNGTATATLNIPSGFAAGSYTVNASYSDGNNAHGIPNYLASTAATAGTLTVKPAATQTNLISTSASSTYNTSAAQTATLTATVTSSNGGIVNEGAVTFQVENTSGKVEWTTKANVSNDVATTTLTIPTGFAVGTYTITASYADSTNANNAVNYSASTSSTNGTLTVGPALTQTFLTTPAASSVFNSTTAQTVNLTASVISLNGGTVNEGAVTFTVGNPNGGDLAVTRDVNNGTASATLMIPAGFAAGSYLYSASYADSYNANGALNYSASAANSSGTLTVKTANTVTSIASSPITSTYNGTNQERLTLTASVTSNNGGTVGDGVVTFVLSNPNGKNLIVTGNVSGGTTSANLTLPAGFAVGSYGFSASYADSTNANNTTNYASSSAASGIVNITAAATTTTIVSSNVSSVYNSITPQSVTLIASVASGSGDIVSEGTVTFSLSNPNGANRTAKGSVVNGTATATLTLPAGFAAGTYSFNASYADSGNANGVANYQPSSSVVSGSLNVKTASSQTNVMLSNLTLQYSPNAQLATVSATVTSRDGGTVNEGAVTFALAGVTSMTAAVNGNGQAIAVFHLPPGFALGNYTVTGTYTDGVNPNGFTSFGSSSAASVLTIVPMASTVSLKQVLVFPIGQYAVELVTAVVNNSMGPVNGGVVGFNIDGLIHYSAVKDGQASTFAIVPLPVVAVPEMIGLSFTPPSFDMGEDNARSQLLYNILSTLNEGFVLLGADGSQIVATLINGLPFGLAYNAEGVFTGFALGIFPTMP